MIHSLSLSDVLADHARSRPGVTATVDGELRHTYAELDLRVTRLAAALAGAGVSTGDRVVWLGQNAHAVLELLLACSRLGAVFCPANWRQSPDELRFVLDDLTPAVVVFEPSEATTSLRAAGAGTWLQAGDEYERAVAEAPVREFGPVDDAEPVLALYTAAFAGRPSAALLSSAALVAHATSLLVVRRMEPGFTFLNDGPLFHVGTMMFCLATFQIGGTNVFTPAFDPEEVCRLIDAERVTQAFLFGPMIDAVAKANAGGKYDLSSLRFVSHSAEWDDMITVDDSPWCRSKMGGYGQTEVGGMLTFLGLAEGGAGFAGRPSPLVQVRLLAPDGTEVPAGEVGEICARGKTLFSGYFARPDLNAEKTAYGWHHTGDLGRREPDGTLTFIGPKLRMIKSGAENVYPAEVERALKTHPAVADAAVIGVPDPGWQQAVKAVVALRPDAAGGVTGGVTADDLIEHVRTLLASYKKPRHVTFVDSIPKRGFTPDYDALDAAHGGGGYPGNA
ncbi:long-chain acyl-CoA synthetase [Nonomuraea fuscirosea]|uniref:Long-chain acyl-CoA synthetase n=1 Tax=Nonomuraea fuscirosea TaxID=1291556 RepID=A0A2T0N8P5_9ACTN|nr:AMP-binding protein [Nonomuraea fuscirosea]PRX69016.1 long-chain acyl-CoA synthetase [Nonomuraea fuscirosea]